MTQSDRRLTAARRRAIDRLLAEYLEQPGERQSAFLARCRDRWPRLGRHLAELVHTDSGATLTVLDRPLRGVADRAMAEAERFDPNRLEPGYSLGPWRLDEAVGEGGMGAVYKGERADGAFDKTVAIKLLRLRGAGLSEQLQRECRLLARLDHPAITRLLDAGLDAQAGPFLVMEWIEGQDLPAWLAGKPSRIRRLEVMSTLCEAVVHAHRQLIIHGDIKPGNVRIDADGRVKLMDFGVARLFGSEVDSAPAIAGLTPTFAAPEQRRGEELTARSDVWALGALLAWMVEGQVPGRDVPAPPPAGERRNAKELRAIVDTACADSPEARYGSADELLAEIRRFLERRPLKAVPATAAYRARKFVRRNPVLVGGVGATTIVLIAGLVTTSIGFVEAERKANELAQVAAFQARQLGRIEPSAMGAGMRQALLDERRGFLDQAGTAAEVEAGVEALDSALAGVNFTNIALQALDETIFDQSLAAIDDKFADQPRIRAALLQTVATTVRRVGLLEQAVASQQQALSLRTEILGEDHPDTLESLHQRGQLQSDLADYEAAEETLHRVLSARERVLGTEHPDTLRSANALGTALRRQDRLEEAQAIYDDVLETRRRVLGEGNSDTINALANKGAVLRAQGRLDEALPFYREVVEARENVLGRDHPDTLQAMNNLGLLHVDRDELDRAEPFYREALDGQRRTLGDHHPSTVVTLNNMAALMRLKGRYDEAEDYYLKTLKVAKQVLGSYHANTLNLYNNLGFLYRKTGDLQASEHHLRRAMEGRARALGPDHRATLNARHNLAATLLEMGRLDEAERLQAEAVAGIEQAVRADHWYRAAFLNNYGRILTAKESFGQAEEILLEARAIFEAELGAEHERTIDVTAFLGEFYGQWAKADPGAGHRDQHERWLARLEAMTEREEP